MNSDSKLSSDFRILMNLEYQAKLSNYMRDDTHCCLSKRLEEEIWDRLNDSIAAQLQTGIAKALVPAMTRRVSSGLGSEFILQAEEGVLSKINDATYKKAVLAFGAQLTTGMRRQMEVELHG